MKPISAKLLTSVNEFGEKIEKVVLIYQSGNSTLGYTFLSFRAAPEMLKRLRLELRLASEPKQLTFDF